MRTTGSAATVLIVDDDPAMRDVLVSMATLAGHRVLGADGGPAALALLAAQAVDLVVTDLNMRPMSGLDLVRDLRSRGNLVPVVLVTGDGVDPREAADVACTLAKPVRPADLHGAIQTALAA